MPYFALIRSGFRRVAGLAPLGIRTASRSCRALTCACRAADTAIVRLAARTDTDSASLSRKLASPPHLSACQSRRWIVQTTRRRAARGMAPKQPGPIPW